MFGFFIYRHLIYLEFIFVYNMSQEFSFIFAMWKTNY